MQEFVPELKEDWKILVFGEKYYVLNRKTRDNDFRASGSGKLSFIDPPDGLLDFSRRIFEKLSVPYVSIDVCEKDGQFYLIEYQSVHFGPYTLQTSPWYFMCKNGGWEKVEKKSELAEEFARSIKKYINKE